MSNLIQCDFCKKIIAIGKEKHYIIKEQGNTSLFKEIDRHICKDCLGLVIDNYCNIREKEGDDDE
ncbi:hypothetical protein [Clostridioides sp. ZZV14-6044]|uniref:hypothetical protein n=1 Tax=unclassified Clostridioides TaxID=2635829 RepID=UPI001D11F531|nr:hypothetical protein [Clostridioides sp. ZZV14-6104]MCC0744598.1 hypothetical protein [Clostridioides sp. ZZV14-6044]